MKSDKIANIQHFKNRFVTSVYILAITSFQTMKIAPKTVKLFFHLPATCSSDNLCSWKEKK